MADQIDRLKAALSDRYVREIEIAANLTHPHIVPLFDSGEADGFLYYVMPAVSLLDEVVCRGRQILCKYVAHRPNKRPVERQPELL